MKKCKLTFGIPAYNSASFIEELLLCFKDDLNFDYEILIVNDGSSDNTLELCQKFNNKRIRIIDKKNEGVSCARNDIIYNALGEWITFVDSDDLIDLKKYINVFDKLITQNNDFYIYCKNNVDLKDKKMLLKFLIENEIINSPCMKFYKKNLLIDNLILFDKNIELGEDLLFNINYYLKCNNIGIFNENLYFIRTVNNNSLTKKYRSNKFKELMYVYEKCLELCNDSIIADSFEFIRVKNCLSCLKSEIIYKHKTLNQITKYVINMKKYKKCKKIRLVSLRKLFIYYLWYFVPSIFLVLSFELKEKLL